jgi:hypothetical protein
LSKITLIYQHRVGEALPLAEECLELAEKINSGSSLKRTCSRVIRNTSRGSPPGRI